MAGDTGTEGAGASLGPDVVELPGKSSQRYVLSDAEVRDLDRFVKLGLLGGWFARWGRVMVDVRRKDGKYLVLRSKRDVQALLAGLNSAAKAPKEGEQREAMASPAVGDAGRSGGGPGHGVHRF